jgi:hypothetical protein
MAARVCSPSLTFKELLEHLKLHPRLVSKYGELIAADKSFASIFRPKHWSYLPIDLDLIDELVYSNFIKATAIASYSFLSRKHFLKSKAILNEQIVFLLLFLFFF